MKPITFKTNIKEYVIMDVMYERPLLTLIFIGAIGFWYVVGKVSEKNLDQLERGAKNKKH